MTDTEKFLAEVKARVEKATAGPWETGAGGDVLTVEELPTPIGRNLRCQIIDTPLNSQGRADREFIAHSRTDIPRLVAMVETARKALKSDCFCEYSYSVPPELIGECQYCAASRELDRLAAGGGE